MYFTDEKDYIMRMIKEMVRILFSLIYGKKYVSVELEKENKYEVSGKNLKSFLDMIDSGQINEAENILLDNIDYANNDEVMAAALFYQYLSEKDSEFLINNNYTKEEVLSGFKQLLVPCRHGVSGRHEPRRRGCPRHRLPLSADFRRAPVRRGAASGAGR